MVAQADWQARQPIDEIDLRLVCIILLAQFVKHGLLAVHLQQLREIVRQEQVLVDFVLEQARKLELYFYLNLAIFLVSANRHELMVCLLDC